MTGTCLMCGTFAFLGPGRLNGRAVYCGPCLITMAPLPDAITAAVERRLSIVDLDARGITSPAEYQRRNQ